MHGDNPVVMDGQFASLLVVVEFPSMEQAHGWYFSKANQEILPLRRDNSTSAVMLLDGVGPGYAASHLLSRY